MRCDNKVVYETRRKRGPGTEYQHPVASYSWFHLKQGQTRKPEDAARWETCGGEIEVRVGIGSDGGCHCCGGTEVEVAYKCKRCSGTYYPELVQTADDLAAFLTKQLAALSQSDVEELRAQRWELEIQSQERTRKFSEELAARRKKK